MKRALFLVAILASCNVPRSTPEPVATLELSAAELVVRLPPRATGALHIERSTGVFLDVESVGARDVPARKVDGRVVYDEAFAGTRVVHVASAGRTEELRYVAHDASSLRYRVKLGPELARLRVVEDYVEALDRNGVARLRTEPAYLVDANGSKRWLLPRVERAFDAWSLEYAIDDAGLTYPLAIDPAWTVTTSLARARRDHRMELLPSGKVVAFGGKTPLGNTASAEIWDPATSSWTSAGALAAARTFHASLMLASGKILVAGDEFPATPSAELYDPATGTSTLLPNPPVHLSYWPTVTQLADGTVLIVAHTAQYVLNPTTRTWTDVPMAVLRDSFVTMPIAGGRVLVAGGIAGPTTFSTAEIFDPSTKTWSAAASMSVPRGKPIGQPLAGGKALVAGGSNNSSSSLVVHSSAEIYDPATNKWTLTPPMKSPHSYCDSVLMPGNRVLVLAGDLPDGLTDLTDLYDGAANTWVLAGRISAPRDEFPAVLLPSGKVLISGGNGGSPVAITEVFSPLPVGQACVGNGECASGFCVDGACCEKSSCATGETCAGAGAAGKCAKKDGATCATNAECGSAHCVDNVCCNSACTDVCAACDVASKVGTCTAVAAGDAPHGSRAPCVGEGVCRARCGGVDPTRCTQLPGTAIVCAEATCKDGVESRVRGCDAAGGCAPATTRPCAPYACGTTACKTQCDVDADCAEGNSCDLVSRRCVIAASCDGDHTVTSPDGKAKDCAPFRCSGARCLDTCEDSSGCTTGFVCDTAAKKCLVGAAPAVDDGGGCAYGADGRPRVFLLVGMLLALVSRMRRRTGTCR